MQTFEMEDGLYVVRHNGSEILEICDWNGNEAPNWVWEMAEDKVGGEK